MVCATVCQPSAAVSGRHGIDVDTSAQVKHIRRSHVVVAVVVAIFGIGLAVTVGWAAQAIQHQQWETQFSSTSTALQQQLEKVSDRTEGQMYQLASSVLEAHNLTAGAEQHTACGIIPGGVIRPDVFDRLAQPVLDHNPFITTMQFAPHVRTDAERHKWEGKLQCRTGRNITFRASRTVGRYIMPPNSGPYFPVTHFVPWKPESAVLLLNTHTSPSRYVGFETSARDNVVVATAPIELFRGGLGILLDLVVSPYPTPTHTDPAVQGVVVAVLEVSPLVESVIAPELARSSGTYVQVVDETEDAVVYASRAAMPEALSSDLVSVFHFPFTTHTWRLTVIQVEADELLPFPWWLLSVIIALLTCVGLYMIASRSKVSVMATVEVGDAAMAASEHVYRQIIQYICHEVRNPIHAAVGSLNEVDRQLARQAPLMRGDDGETVLTDLRNGIAAINQLTRVVDDVMAMRKDYNTKQLTIHPRVVANFATVVRDLGNQYRAIVMSNVQLVVSAPPAFPAAKIDVSRLRQLLGNGVHNASKHTNGGSVAIHARVLGDALPNVEVPWVLCVVSNTTRQPLPPSVVAWNDSGLTEDRRRFGDVYGAVRRVVEQDYLHADAVRAGTMVRITGNPQSDLQKRVERYLTLRGSTGMGLPMCRDIARAMGGFMGVEHVPQQGATVFWVAMPFPPPQQSPGSARSPTSPRLAHSASTGAVLSSGRDHGSGSSEEATATSPLAALSLHNIDGGAPLPGGVSSPAIGPDGSIHVSMGGGSDGGAGVAASSANVSGGGGNGGVSHGATAVAVPVAASPAAASSSVSDTVVVVDDERTIRKLAQRWLKRAGFDVRVACNGAEAVEAVEAVGSCAGVMMDIVMMPMDGVAACVELRSRGITVPIIAMTSNCSGTDVERYKASGFNGLLPKPFKSADITRAVRAAQQAARPMPGWWTPPLDGGTTPQHRPTQQSGTVLIVDDDAISRRLAQRWVKRGGFRAVAAASGEEALKRFGELTDVVGVTLDLSMEPMDGFEVCRRLRALNASIPIVAVTGTDDAATRARVEQCGFSGILPKPASADTMAAWCKSLTAHPST